MKKPSNPKERNLIKAALRRVFSRSELRLKALNSTRVPDFIDPERPRVTKWSVCSICRKFEPTYKMQIDHVDPLLPLGKSLEDFSWDEIVDRLWCDASNLQPVCQTCHKQKSKIENKERRLLKKAGRK